MSDRIITMACLYKESVKEVNQLKKEIEIKDKRISLLTETLANRDKDIETLKAEITRQNNIIMQLSEKLTRALYFKQQFRNGYYSKKKVIKKMAEWIHKKDVNCTFPVKCNFELFCEDCIINYFESEVKE